MVGWWPGSETFMPMKPLGVRVYVPIDPVDGLPVCDTGNWLMICRTCFKVPSTRVGVLSGTLSILRGKQVTSSMSSMSTDVRVSPATAVKVKSSGKFSLTDPFSIAVSANAEHFRMFRVHPGSGLLSSSPDSI